MTLHFKERATERCPNIDAIKMQHAVETYCKTGQHEAIDFIIETRDGVQVLRYNQGDVVTYPVVNVIFRDIITIYTQEFVKSLKKRAKFKRKIRSRKYWKGKT